MKIFVSDINPDLIDAWTEVFDPQPELDVEVYPGSIFDLNVDALVSPANSFGFMDGSLDLAISLYFGWHIQQDLQNIIEIKHHGELLVGLAEVIKTQHPKIPYVVSAPTMRVPMILGDTTINPYLAVRAALLEIKKHPDIKSIAFPGMGTGVGAVPVKLCAHQMSQAIKNVMYCASPANWQEAQLRHQALLLKNYKDLQKK